MHSSRYLLRCFRQTGIKLGKGWTVSQEIFTCGLKTSPLCQHMLDARDEDHHKKEEQLTIQKAKVFEEIAKTQRNKLTFQLAIHKYTTLHDKYNRGSVEFINASMTKMKEFNVHRDIEVYKQVLDILPKGKLVTKTAWQAEMMHYPKQQQCAIDLMEQMEVNGVIPDDEFGYLLKDIFGTTNYAFRRYQRMMYWMPKFKHANPYPIPYEVPKDPMELARLALERMCVDRNNKILDFQTTDLEQDHNIFDETYVVSAQSSDQIELLKEHNCEKPVYVEGGFTVWLRQKSLTYFTLKSDTTARYKAYTEEQKVVLDEHQEHENFLQDIPFFNTKANVKTSKEPTVHEQNDGTVLAMCITGTGSKNSLVSWIKLLQKSNPLLSTVPVVFRLDTPEAGLTVIKGEEERLNELVENDMQEVQ